MATTIDRRRDVNPNEGEHEYGEVDFADPVNKKYPIDTAKHVRAAWSYIHHPDNAGKYDEDEVALTERRIKAAAKKRGQRLLGVEGDGAETEVNPMSANIPYLIGAVAIVLMIVLAIRRGRNGE